jgi:hypothetical protein
MPASVLARKQVTQSESDPSKTLSTELPPHRSRFDFIHGVNLNAERLALDTSLSVTAFFTCFLQPIGPFAAHSFDY